MENLSHSLVGLMLGRLGLDRGDKHLSLLLILAANAPDVDYCMVLGDPATYLQVHRGYSHSLVAAPALALAPLILVSFGERLTKRLREHGYTFVAFLAWLNLTGIAPKRGAAYSRTYRAFTIRRFFYLWFCCVLAILSHLLLDWTSVYGVRMMLPFSNEWMHLDLTNIIDPVIVASLILATVAPIVVNVINLEVGSQKSQSSASFWAWVAIMILCTYTYARYQSHAYVVEKLEDHRYQIPTPNAALALPDAALAVPDTFSPLRWRGLVKIGKWFLEIPVVYEGQYILKTRRPEFEYQAGRSTAIESARRTRDFQVFESLNMAQLWTLSPRGENLEVELVDMRFGTFRYPDWKATALVAPGGAILRTHLGPSRR